MLLLQIATRFSKWEKHVAKKMVVPRKGCRSSERELLYIRAPSIWCTLQCIISWTGREIFFLPPNTLFYDFSRKYLCKTWWYHENFRNPMDCFRKLHHSINDNNFSYLTTIGVKTTIGLTGSLMEGESDFKNFLISSSHHFVQKQ